MARPPFLPVSVPIAVTLLACGASHSSEDDVDGGRVIDGTIPTPDCTTLTEAECIGSPSCGPIYDDFCCPLCLPTGGCADCQQPQMYLCGSMGEACADDPPICGGIGGWTCRGGVAGCAGARAVSNGRCDIPGCVQAIEAGCVDDCPVACVPVTGDSCTASCRLDPPPCPEGMINEGDGSCYTGRCIAASACMQAASIAIGP